MQRHCSRWSLAGWIIGTFFLVGTAKVYPVPASYHVIDLGIAAPAVARTQGGGAGSVTIDALAEDGTVVGSVSAITSEQAAILYPTVTMLGTLSGGMDSYALGISGGTVVGYATTGPAGDHLHGFVWTAQTGMQDLIDDTITGDPTVVSVATALNASGLIVGFAADAGTIKPFMWQAGHFQMLPTLGGANGDATMVNAAGIIVGESQTATQETHATMWIMGFPIDLNPHGAQLSAAKAMNSQADVAGDAWFPTGFHAFRWTVQGGAEDLGTLPNHIISHARGMNDAGMIVGVSIAPGEDPPPALAVRWTLEQGIEALDTLLSTPGWTLYDAIAVNNAGAILAYGTVNGQDHAVLVVPDDDPLAQAHRHKHQFKHRHITVVRLGR